MTRDLQLPIKSLVWVSQESNPGPPRQGLNALSRGYHAGSYIPFEYVSNIWKEVISTKDSAISEFSICKRMFRDRSIFTGELEPVHFKFSVWKKSMSYIDRKQIQNTILSVLRLKKSSSSVIILAKKSMCPIAFCTGPNPPMNIDQSLSTKDGDIYLNSQFVKVYV